jgi:hypothetical protein
MHLLMTTALFDNAVRDRPYAYSYARVVPHLTYGLYHICGLSGVCLSYFSCHGIYSEGLPKGIIELLLERCCVSMFVGSKMVLARKPYKPRKTCKRIKVEASNFVLQWGLWCDMVDMVSYVILTAASWRWHCGLGAVPVERWRSHRIAWWRSSA